MELLGLAALDARTPDGSSAIHLAATEGHVESWTISEIPLTFVHEIMLILTSTVITSIVWIIMEILYIFCGFGVLVLACPHKRSLSGAS